MRYRGLLYRALNPVWAHDPLSGEGARRFGGRFNPKGMPALYTSFDVATALRESNRVGSLQPTTVVSYEADIEPIFDTTDSALLEQSGVSPSILAASDWRDMARGKREALSQALARRLLSEGYAGLEVRSFAPGTGPDSRNLVLWVWGPDLPTRLTLIDDEGRLSG